MCQVSTKSRLQFRNRTEPTVTVRFGAGGASGGDGEHEKVELGGVGFEVAGGRGGARVPHNPLRGDEIVVRGLVDPADEGLPKAVGRNARGIDSAASAGLSQDPEHRATVHRLAVCLRD